MITLVVNPGSSSIKYSLFKKGRLLEDASYQQKKSGIERKEGKKKTALKMSLSKSFEDLYKHWELKEYGKKISVAIRIVHDGGVFQGPTSVNKSVLKKFEKTIPMAPLHNAVAYELIKELYRVLPKAQIWMFFDSSFHQKMPDRNRNYALSEKLLKKLPAQRKGFHGISMASVLRKLQEKNLLMKRTVVCHLGGGTSVTVLEKGRSIYNSMGFTALEGPIMMSRSGSVDPGLLLLLSQKVSPQQLDVELYQQSGMKALCGDIDMQLIIKKAMKGQKKYREALDMYCQSVAEEIGKCIVIGKGIDQLVFTGTIGAKSSYIREKIIDYLQPFGAKLHHAKNEKASEGERICRRLSRIRMRWVQTDEQAELARQLKEVLNAERAL